MHYIIKYDSQLTGERGATCLADVITGTPRKFPNKIAAEKSARLSGFTNAQFIKKQGD